MFNVKVFKLKDLTKYLLCIVTAIILLYCANRYFFYNKESLKFNINISKLICLEYPQIQEIEAEACTNIYDEDELLEQDISKKLIETELGIIKYEFNSEENTVIAENKDERPKEEINSQPQSGEKKETEVVTKNPLADAYTQIYNGVKIKNETGYTLSDDILQTDSLSIDTNNIIIFHTHTCESYTSSENYQYDPVGNFRTTDLNYTVARVGDELSKLLSGYGFNVNHNKNYHDYPAYTGSYSRSLKTVEDVLNSYKADIIIDLHRDAIGSRPDYAPTVKIGDEYAAQVMFVMGTNGGGLYHPNWSNNLKFAVKVQEMANEMYPGLFKPIIVRNSRYNQHLGKAACIIEVGSTGNTLDETLNSMKYLSQVLYKAFK